jgi:arylsulfatase A
MVVGDNGTGKGIQSQLGDDTIHGGKGTLTRAGMHVPLIVNWPAAIAPGVHDGLIDTTDFLPTVCAATGTEIPSRLATDGQSFLPLLLKEKDHIRDWYYCWYAPRGKFVGEFAATADYKLYRDGRFIDLRKDPTESSPLSVDGLPVDATAAKKLLSQALAKYANSRSP